MRKTLSAHAVLNTLPNAVFIKNESLQFVFVNKAYEVMFGVKKEDMIGKTVLDVFHLPEQDKQFYHDEDREMILQGATSHHIFEYLFKDGKVHTCLYWSGGFIQENGLRGLVGVIVDITLQSKTIKTLKSQLKSVVSEKKTIEEKSSLDALTNVYNRRFFDDFLKKYADLSTKNGTFFSCIMIDIDYFKKVNDVFGHLVGDDVLKQLASVLKGCLRDDDVVCRYGGEEFVLLLPGRNVNEAVLVAERLRKRVSETVRLPDGEYVTVSAGCSEYIIGEKESDFLKRADDALYKAKTTGRNRVCAAPGKEG